MFNQYIFQEWYEQELDDVNDELVEANEENRNDFKEKGSLQENLNALLCCIKVSMQFDVSSANLRSLCYKKNLEKCIETICAKYETDISTLCKKEVKIFS